MRRTIVTLWQISRPRFWLYLIGPAAVGMVTGITHPHQLFQLSTLLILGFFSWPANLIMYGVNDLADEKTDRENKKKKSYEHLLLPSEKRGVLIGIVTALFLTVLLGFWLPMESVWWLALWLFLALAYSSAPLRLKGRPFLDAYSNVLYAIPGLVGYSFFALTLPPWWVLVALLTWNAGMHTFSAIPDIGPDKKAGVRTTAVLLGPARSLLFVTSNWLVSALCGLYAFSVFGLPFIICPLISGRLFGKKDADIFTRYKQMPMINAALGLYLFWLVLLSRFGWREVWNTLLSLFLP